MVTKQALEEFIEIYRQEFGVIPPQQIAMEEAERLLALFKVIYKPIKKQPADVGKDGYGNGKQKAIKTR